MAMCCCAHDSEPAGAMVVVHPAPTRQMLAPGEEAQPEQLPETDVPQPKESGKLPTEGRVATKQPTLSLLFQTPSGDMVETRMFARPMGVDFNKTLPLRVRGTRPGGRGEKSGIQAGWELIQINGVIVDGRDGQNGLRRIEEVRAFLVELTNQLPERSAD
uniref:PDZ domain-containing protein n=1 Tax=Zooxanthella nutricula TaxID=1333877 RepID=A0A6U8W276_9DINO|mmetsp:Transcript_10052/g.29853  ORF Transcript_10052/g.29853 Transcript_10052/m.29853 type:complete len:160 (+) Transcript_10052:91-570(+)